MGTGDPLKVFRQGQGKRDTAKARHQRATPLHLFVIRPVEVKSDSRGLIGQGWMLG